MTGYEAGACNIGSNERRMRRLAGIASLVVGAVYLVAVLFVSTLPTTAVLGVSVFVFGGTMGLLQSRLQFCVGYGTLGRYDLSGDGGESGTVSDASDRRQDRVRSLVILGTAFWVTLLTTLALYWLTNALLV